MIEQWRSQVVRDADRNRCCLLPQTRRFQHVRPVDPQSHCLHREKNRSGAQLLARGGGFEGWKCNDRRWWAGGDKDSAMTRHDLSHQCRLTCIRRIDGGHCARRPMAMLCRLLLVLLPRGICRHHRCHRRTTTCKRREGERGGGGPTFLCKRVPGGRASGGAAKTSAEQRPLVG